MHIRAARKNDADDIVEYIAMAEGEVLFIFAGSHDVEKAKQIVLPFVVSPTPTRYSFSNALVAEVDDRVAGAIISFPADDQPTLDVPLVEWLNSQGRESKLFPPEGEPGSYYLSAMGVDAAFRGRGVGSALLNAALGKAKGLGYDRASLIVASDNPKARSLYERFGFDADSMVYVAGHECVRMVMTI